MWRAVYDSYCRWLYREAQPRQLRSGEAGAIGTAWYRFSEVYE